MSISTGYFSSFIKGTPIIYYYILLGTEFGAGHCPRVHENSPMTKPTMAQKKIIVGTTIMIQVHYCNRSRTMADTPLTDGRDN